MKQIRLHKSMVPDTIDISQVLKTGMVSNWKHVKKLEEKLKQVHNVKYALCFSSCTSAIMLLFYVLKIKKVAIPSFTWISAKYALDMLKIKTELMDIEEDTWVVPHEEQERLKDKVDMFFITSTFGNKPKISFPGKTILDSAHCGAHEGFGNLGLAEVISFAPSKTFTGMEGGAILTNDKEIHDKLRKIQHPTSRMGEINAKVALYNYNRRKEIFRWKEEVLKRYKKNLPFAIFQKINDYSTHNEIAIRIPNWKRGQWETLGKYMESRRRYDPDFLAHQEKDTISAKVYSNIVTLPSYIGADVDEVIDVLNKIHDGRL